MAPGMPPFGHPFGDQNRSKNLSKTTKKQPTNEQLKPRITVIGVGGAGCNAVNNMIEAHLEGVEFLVANTDAQSLASSLADRRVQLGAELTKGLGAGAKPEIGRQAADESLSSVIEQLEGTHMLFVTAGIGGGSVSGAAPLIAEAAREIGIDPSSIATSINSFKANSAVS